MGCLSTTSTAFPPSSMAVRPTPTRTALSPSRSAASMCADKTANSFERLGIDGVGVSSCGNKRGYAGDAESQEERLASDFGCKADVDGVWHRTKCLRSGWKCSATRDSDYALDMSCTVTAVRDRREKLFFFTALRVNDATRQAAVPRATRTSAHCALSTVIIMMQCEIKYHWQKPQFQHNYQESGKLSLSGTTDISLRRGQMCTATHALVPRKSWQCSGTDDLVLEHSGVYGLAAGSSLLGA
eukprot:2281235-Rhodomonas_salina.5